MDNTEKKILNGLEDLPCEHLFKKEVERLLEGYLNSGQQLNKLIGTLEETLSHDAEYFWKDLCRANLLTFLYTKTKNIQRLKKATEINDKCLVREPTNINGLACRVVLLKNNNKFAKSQEMLAELTAQRNEMALISAKAEIAYCLEYVGPLCYRNSIQKYEDILREIDNSSLGSEHYKKITMWKFHLAQTYSRLMNKGNLEEKLLNKGDNIPKTMSRIFALLNEVIESKNEDYLGKAYIDMADAVKKYETSAVEGTLDGFSNHLSSDEYVRKALLVAPNDVYVLERAGRHYKQRAMKAKEFKKAIEILQLALTICPSRHVACHHIALAYKCLWLIDEKHDETKLFNNSAKQGKKKSVIRLQVKTQTKAEGDQSNKGAPLALDSDEKTQGSSSAKNNKHHYGPRPHPTVPARTRELGHMQAQSRKRPDYFDKLRTSNPRCKKYPTNTNLSAAVTFLKKAIQYCPTSSRYHIDLGRLYVSLGNKDEARWCFQKAKSPDNFMDDNDAAYLYEQEGLLEEKMRSPIDDVKVLYRKAIMHAVKAKVRSKMAFYNLRDILFRQKEEGHADHKIELELNLLYRTMEQYANAKQCLKASLENDETNVSIIWELIRTMYLDKTEGDAENAFRYLSILESSGKLDLNNAMEKEDCEDGGDDGDAVITSSKRSMILELMKIAMIKDPGVCKKVFNWLIESTPEKVPLSADMDTARKSDVCVLMSYQSSFAEQIVVVLKTICNLEVKFSLEDIPFGSNTRSEMIKIVDESKAIIVVVDEDGQDWPDILLVTHEHLVGSKFNVCLVFEREPELQPTRSINFMRKWSRFTLDKGLSDEMLIYQLYRKMLETPHVEM